MRRIVVTGSSGWLGGRISQDLEKSGYSVGRISRSRGTADEFPWDFAGDAPLGSLADFLRGAHSIIHCAAKVHAGSGTEAGADQFHKVNVEGTRRLIEAARMAGVYRVVFLSTVAVEPPAHQRKTGAVEADQERDTAYPRSKRVAEKVVQESGLDWRIARLAVVFGEGDVANFLRLARAINRRRFFVPGRGEARKSVVTVERAVEIVRRLAEAEVPCHRMIDVGRPERPSLREICDAFSEICSFPRVPAFNPSFCRLLARVGDGLGALGIKLPFNSTILAKLTTDTCADVTRQSELFPDLQWGSFKDDLRRHRDYYINAS